jgi:hypothetical protein
MWAYAQAGRNICCLLVLSWSGYEPGATSAALLLWPGLAVGFRVPHMPCVDGSWVVQVRVAAKSLLQATRLARSENKRVISK